MLFHDLPVGAIFQTNFCHGVYMKIVPKRPHSGVSVYCNATQLDTGYFAYFDERNPVETLYETFIEMCLDLLLAHQEERHP